MTLSEAWKVARFQIVRKGGKCHRLASVQVCLPGMPETKWIVEIIKAYCNATLTHTPQPILLYISENLGRTLQTIL